MDRPDRDGLETAAQQPGQNLDIKTGEKKNDNGAEQHANDSKTGILPPGDPENNQVAIPQTPDEPGHEYATPRELALLSTVFTIATFMIAIDGSILGKKKTHTSSASSL